MELDLEALTNGFKKKTKNKNQKNKKETFTEIYCNITKMLEKGCLDIQRNMKNSRKNLRR